MNRYVIKSLELHLFFCRIMKEHSLFLQAGFTPADYSYAVKAESYRKEFEALLRRAIELSDGMVGNDVLCSGELTTEYTLLAEQQTECLTGIPINKDLTKRAQCLKARDGGCEKHGQLRGEVRLLNRTALKLLDGLICLQESVLKNVLQGEMFTVNYPLLLEHITREAKLYRSYVQALERDGDLTRQSMRETEVFWNQIMMEHAWFIRGLLDPCETELMDNADEFGKSFCALLEASRKAQDKTLTARTLEEAEKLRDFKAAGAKGISENSIRSVILPLLADHVLREANHFIRLLKK